MTETLTAPTTDNGQLTTDKVAITDCFGKTIVCPVCGKDAVVDHARGAKDRGQVISSKWWVLVRCKGTCGSALRKVNTMVVCRDATPDPPAKKPLGHVIGHFVKCPVDNCGAKSRAAWELDQGHAIDCPTHQLRKYDSETLVEVIA